ncbi:MAG: transcriptional regulator protein [Hyphomicrobiales bacterium]|nr:transcriptional regulator protein [Hyphomicrobiales bacterium]
MATELGVGVRSLQCSFRRVRGASPHEAITIRRLEGARSALLKAEPSVTVTKIAAEFCFFELGRFSKRYRERFGETPSQTLARGAAADGA